MWSLKRIGEKEVWCGEKNKSERWDEKDEGTSAACRRRARKELLRRRGGRDKPRARQRRWRHLRLQSTTASSRGVEKGLTFLASNTADVYSNDE